MHSITKDETTGQIIRARTRRMGVTIQRQSYKGKDGATRYTQPFYYSQMIHGELARFPLSPDPIEAERTADIIAAFLLDPTNTLMDAKRKFNPRALSRPNNFSTIGDLFEFHEEHRKVLELSERAAKGYRHSLLLILRKVEAWRKGAEFESWAGQHDATTSEKLSGWLERPLTEITGRVATDYQRLMVPPDIEDEEEELTAKISSDSNLRSARAMFSREAMKLYQRSEKLALPDLSDFLSVGLFNAKKYFVLPNVDVIRAIFAAAPALRADDINAYRAFLLCVQAGLRKTEAANFRLDWLQEEDTPVILIHTDGKFKPKHGHGRKVLLDPWVAEEIRGLAEDRPHFVDGTDTERGETVFVRLNSWLRKCGVDSTKPTHELRKLWFSQKVKRESLLAAAQQGGHRDPKVTTSFYASSQMPDNVLPFWQEPTLRALAKIAKAG